MTLFALAIPFVGTAQAIQADCSVNVELETAQNTVGTQHTLTATAGQRTGGGGTCTTTTAEIDLEIIATSGTGAYTFVSYTGSTSAGIDAAESNTTPDMTCNTSQAQPGASQCTVTYVRSDAGNDTIKAWVDADNNNTTTEQDTTEGRNEATTPGSVTEADGTDVVEKQWQGTTPAGTYLDCDDASGDDAATNPHIGDGSTEAYTCTLKNNAGTANVPGDDTVVAGAKIDAENQSAAVNDPGDDGGVAGTADYNDFCTTDAAGTCTANVVSEGQQGTATICFWADLDADTSFEPAGADQDGGQCAEASADEADSSTGGAAADNITDVVTKTWAQRVASTITVTPQADNNLVNTSHTITIRVTDQFGAIVVGANVDVRVTGRNTRTTNDLVTGNDGTTTFTYTDTGSAVAAGADTITVCMDTITDNDTCPALDGGEDSDTATKNWVLTLPTAASVVLDMQGDDDLPAALGGNDAGPDTANACDEGAFDVDATSTNTVGVYGGTGTPTAAGPGAGDDHVVHEVCAVARDANAAAIVGLEYTFSLEGPGNFTNEDGEDLGTSVTVGSDQGGHGHAAITSTESGTTTVTVTVGTVTDSGTKTWRGTAARTLDCEPETASNEPGTTHVITCTARDAFGNPTRLTSFANIVADAVCVTESGPGRITSPTALAGACSTVGATLSATGTIEVIVETTANESGTQTISAELDSDDSDLDDVADTDDECEVAAGRGPGNAGAVPGTLAGLCEDDVEKVWEAQPIVQCNDGQDNDFDGDIDFPADNGCTDANDDDESDEPITETDHDVNVSIDSFKKVKLGGGQKSLKVKGTVTSDFEPCFNQTFVKVQLRAGGEWVTRKTDITSASGVWKVLIRHVKGKYRAVVPQFSIFGEDTIDNCLKATDVRKYK